MATVNGYFAPRNVEGLRRVLSFFEADLDKEDDGSFSDDAGFRTVVVSGELQPDLWTSWRYVLLEIWAMAADAKLESLVSRRATKLRPDVADRLTKRTESAIADAEGLKVTHLTDEHRERAESVAEGQFADFLGILGVDEPREAAQLAFGEEEEG